MSRLRVAQHLAQVAPRLRQMRKEPQLSVPSLESSSLLGIPSTDPPAS